MRGQAAVGVLPHGAHLHLDPRQLQALFAEDLHSVGADIIGKQIGGIVPKLIFHHIVPHRNNASLVFAAVVRAVEHLHQLCHALFGRSIGVHVQHGGTLHIGDFAVAVLAEYTGSHLVQLQGQVVDPLLVLILQNFDQFQNDIVYLLHIRLRTPQRNLIGRAVHCKAIAVLVQNLPPRTGQLDIRGCRSIRLVQKGLSLHQLPLYQPHHISTEHHQNHQAQKKRACHPLQFFQGSCSFLRTAKTLSLPTNEGEGRTHG